VWAVGHAATKYLCFREPRTLLCLKAKLTSPSRGEGDVGLGGVFDHGTHEEDGPGTWEALVSPREEPATRRADDVSDAVFVSECTGNAVKEKYSPQR
jgi:hypothetical protein